MTATEYVVLVDRLDQELGREEKLKAHELGLMHRAFSIFIFQGEMSTITESSLVLLQQRAFNKYHSGGLWTNTCCSHPRPGESILEAGKRRLQEELGFSTTLNDHGYFHYIAHFENGMCENEVDHVLTGWIKDTVVIKPATDEVAMTRWVSLKDLKEELETNPQNFTPWLKPALKQII